jgi:hypothetical protein
LKILENSLHTDTIVNPTFFEAENPTRASWGPVQNGIKGTLNFTMIGQFVMFFISFERS